MHLPTTLFCIADNNHSRVFTHRIRSARPTTLIRPFAFPSDQSSFAFPPIRSDPISTCTPLRLALRTRPSRDHGQQQHVFPLPTTRVSVANN
eukprot:201867-Rhodomonas_salina.1